ncbi:RNA polymerase sporulation sigma factor SigH [Veillonella montpellierensis]|uniref:RNA polymerase sporulation sigma factor SigH n=1 Tax=Veillonella montpellierensis TaxID=187328 RepID=UPI0023F9B485|nr:RNA polymerase sporulation sigma factor SigH [Veillonella montpellierensis]
MDTIHKETSDYRTMTDETLIKLAQTKDDDSAIDFIVNKYKNFVRAKARSYFLMGADYEDIIQEGMIGLYKAIRDFKPEKQASFHGFAEICIVRQMITAVKAATRQKHMPLNSYISLNKPIYTEESERTLMDMLSERAITDPEELLISQEQFKDTELMMGKMLSNLEWEVLLAYLDGKPYQTIAEETGRSIKSIDNALQRVKRKLDKYLEERLAKEQNV